MSTRPLMDYNPRRQVNPNLGGNASVVANLLGQQQRALQNVGKSISGMGATAKGYGQDQNTKALNKLIADKQQSKQAGVDALLGTQTADNATYAQQASQVSPEQMTPEVKAALFGGKQDLNTANQNAVNKAAARPAMSIDDLIGMKAQAGELSPQGRDDFNQLMGIAQEADKRKSRTDERAAQNLFSQEMQEDRQQNAADVLMGKQNRQDQLVSDKQTMALEGLQAFNSEKDPVKRQQIKAAYIAQGVTPTAFDKDGTWISSGSNSITNNKSGEVRYLDNPNATSSGNGRNVKNSKPRTWSGDAKSAYTNDLTADQKTWLDNRQQKGMSVTWVPAETKKVKDDNGLVREIVKSPGFFMDDKGLDVMDIYRKDNKTVKADKKIMDADQTWDLPQDEFQDLIDRNSK